MNRVIFAITTFWLIAAFVYYSAFQSLEASNQIYAHTYQVIAQNNYITAMVFEAEANQRGFIITGNPKFIDGYNRAKGSIMPSILEAKTLTEDNSSQQERFEAITLFATERLDELDANLELAKQKLKNAQYKFPMDKISTINRLLKNVGNEELRLLQIRKLANEENFRVVHLATLLGVIVSMGMMIGNLIYWYFYGMD